MPKLSGIETLREIRKIDGEVPVIISHEYLLLGLLRYGRDNNKLKSTLRASEDRRRK